MFAHTTKQRVSERHTTLSRIYYSMYFWTLTVTGYISYVVSDGFISPGEVRDVNREARQLWRGEHPAAAAAAQRSSGDAPGQ